MEIEMSDNKKYWDKAWQRTIDTISYKDVFYLMDEIELKYLLPLLPSPLKSVKTIEVGCGSARLSCFLASHSYNTMCLDYSKDALKVAKNNYWLTNNEGNFVIGDVKSLPFKNNSFDVVLSTGLLEHFTDPQTVVNEMVRILKPGGFFYSDIVPEKFSLLRSLDFLGGIICWSLGRAKNEVNEAYEKKLSKQDIIQLLKLAGLGDIHVFAAGVFPPRLPYPKRIAVIKYAHHAYSRVLYRLKPLFKRLDDTIFAEWLGFYYFVYAKKPK